MDGVETGWMDRHGGSCPDDEIRLLALRVPATGGTRGPAKPQYVDGCSRSASVVGVQNRPIGAAAAQNGSKLKPRLISIPDPATRPCSWKIGRDIRPGISGHVRSRGVAACQSTRAAYPFMAPLPAPTHKKTTRSPSSTRPARRSSSNRINVLAADVLP